MPTTNAILIDTNVLIYAHDGNDLTRQENALRVLHQVESMGNGRMSVQCLGEFFSVATRKLRPPLTYTEAMTQVERISRVYRVLDLTAPIVLEATRGVTSYQLSYYDAQLWATAKLNQISVVFTEDFSSGSILEGIRFVNPFAPDFVLENWG